MDINDIEKIQLTTSQEFVLKQLLSFINHPTDRVFILKGYAGTGKTTLMRFLIRQLESLGKNYQLLASTGRAAKILVHPRIGMNGDVVVVEEISENSVTRAHLTFRQVKVRELFTGNSYSSLMIEEIVNQSKPNLDKQQQHALFLDFIYRMLDKGITAKNNRQAFYDMMFHDPYLNALRCVFGYAITCHKSQGGEWEDVYVHVPRNITKNPTKETYQWIYTSMTRAQKTLHIVDDFYIR